MDYESFKKDQHKLSEQYQELNRQISKNQENLNKNQERQKFLSSELKLNRKKRHLSDELFQKYKEELENLKSKYEEEFQKLCIISQLMFKVEGALDYVQEKTKQISENKSSENQVSAPNSPTITN
jgi:chromosome segregation ATPase